MKKNVSLAALMVVALVTVNPSSYAEMSLSGLIEVEGFVMDSDANDKSSDVVVSTVEVGIDAPLNEAVDVSIVLLAEDIGTDEQTDVGIDQAMVNLSVGNGVVTAGLVYVPFGGFQSAALTDPLTLTLAETAETSLMYGIESDSGFVFQAYVFNGDVDDAGGENNEINDGGLSVSLLRESWMAGIDVISNLGDSVTMGDLDNPAVGDDVPGIAIRGSVTIGNIEFG